MGEITFYIEYIYQLLGLVWNLLVNSFTVVSPEGLGIVMALVIVVVIATYVLKVIGKVVLAIALIIAITSYLNTFTFNPLISDLAVEYMRYENKYRELQQECFDATYDIATDMADECSEYLLSSKEKISRKVFYPSTKSVKEKIKYVRSEIRKGTHEIEKLLKKNSKY